MTRAVTGRAHPRTAFKTRSLSLAIALGLLDQIQFPGFRWHDAASDAIASLVLLQHLIESAGLFNEPAEVLTRPNLTAYFASRRK